MTCRVGAVCAVAAAWCNVVYSSSVQCSAVQCSYTQQLHLYDDAHMAVPGRGGYTEGDEGGPGGGGEVEGVGLVQMSVAFG